MLRLANNRSNVHNAHASRARASLARLAQSTTRLVNPSNGVCRPGLGADTLCGVVYHRDAHPAPFAFKAIMTIPRNRQRSRRPQCGLRRFRPASNHLSDRVGLQAAPSCNGKANVHCSTPSSSERWRRSAVPRFNFEMKIVLDPGQPACNHHRRRTVLMLRQSRQRRFGSWGAT